MVKKNVLGRGLSNFVKDSEKAKELLSSESTGLSTIKIEDIFPNPNQARKYFDERALKELRESIEEFGIIQPLIVRKEGDKFEIVAGERRYRAALDAKLEEVPVIVKDISRSDAEKISLIENVQREDLNPVEEALGYKSIIDAYNLTQETLSQALGKSRSYIANTMRLLKLDERVVSMLEKGLLSASHGKLLLNLKDKEEQYKKAMKIIKEGSTVRETVELIKKPSKIPIRDHYLTNVQERLMEVLGTRVELKGSGNKRKVEIEYYTDEDLTRIMEVILGSDEID